MTRYSKEIREELAKMVKGQIIEKQEYTEDGDYYTITLSDGSEFSFRYMTDLIL